MDDKNGRPLCGSTVKELSVLLNSQPVTPSAPRGGPHYFLRGLCPSVGPNHCLRGSTDNKHRLSRAVPVVAKMIFVLWLTEIPLNAPYCSVEELCAAQCSHVRTFCSVFGNIGYLISWMYVLRKQLWEIDSTCSVRCVLRKVLENILGLFRVYLIYSHRVHRPH